MSSIDRRARLCIFAAISAASVSCGSNPPGYTDHEAVAFDPTSCATDSGGCTHQGNVSVVEAFAPGNHALLLPQGARITAAIAQVDPRWHLVYLVVGLRAHDEPTPTPTRKLEVSITGRDTVIVSPVAGFSRIEFGGDGVVPANATIGLRAIEGDYDVEWVVGRWNE